MDEQYQPGSTSCTAPGLLSKEGVLRLRCPVKLYDGINTIHASRKPTGSSKLQLLEAHAGYTALLGRRELQKTTTHTVTSQQPAALATVSAPHLVQSVQHPVVNSVLYPSNRVVAYSIGAEREHNVAVLAMEKRLAQLNQDLAESKSLVARQHQRLQDVEVAYKQMLLDVEESAENQLEALQRRLAQKHVQQQQFKLLAACVAVWLQHSRQCRHLNSKMQRMQLHRLIRFWQMWLQRVEVSRRRITKMLQLQAVALTAWQDRMHIKALMQQKMQRFRRLHLQHVIGSWQQHVLHQQQLAKYLRRAVLWHNSRTVRRSFQVWQVICLLQLQQADRLAQQVLKRHMRAILQEWLRAAAASTSHRLAALAAQQAAAQQPGLLMLRRVLGQWQDYIALQVQVRYLQHRYQQRLLQRCWHYWAQRPAARAHLQYVESCLTAVGTHILKNWGLQAFKQHTWECRAKLHLQQRRTHRCWAAWQHTAAVMARQRRLVGAKLAARQYQALSECLWQWCKVSVSAARQRAMSLAGKLQETIAQQQAGVASAEARATAAAERLRLVVIHNQQLQQQAVTACVGALAGLQFAPALRWRSLPFSPDERQLQPRARHAAFRLDALQFPAQPVSADSWPSSAAATAVVSCDVLLVYGGVVGDAWLTDLNLLVLQEGTSGDCKLRSLRVPCSHTSSAQLTTAAASSNATGDTNSTDAAQEQQLPLLVREFAACASGRNQFVVAGGFNGEQQTMDLQLCVLKHTQRQTNIAEEAGDVAFRAPNPTSNNDISIWCEGWSATWQIVQPRNRSPPGRCHHTVCHYAEGRSFVVFGGWTDRHGCLNDVWLFHQDHMEWWEPECTGTNIPCHRRSHAAVLLDHQLFVYGGIDSQGQHLDDLWCLDMTKWEWQQAATKECLHPTARRAASLELVGDRYLLLHGGYAGTHQLLQDTWVFDTHTNRWLEVDVSAPASELPVPRALHSFTRIGHRFLAIGGQGGCGPVPDVQLLECPAVTRGLQLEQQHLQSQWDVLHSRKRSAQLDGDLTCRLVELQQCQRQLQGCNHASSVLAMRYAALQEEYSALEARLDLAQQEAAAAQLQADEYHQQVSALERRLLRARQGGRKAVKIAREQEEHLQAADTHIQELQHNLQQCQIHSSSGMLARP